MPKSIKIKDIPPSRIKNPLRILKMFQIAMDELTDEDIEYLERLKNLLNGNE